MCVREKERVEGTVTLKIAKTVCLCSRCSYLIQWVAAMHQKCPFCGSQEEVVPVVAAMKGERAVSNLKKIL